MPDQLTLTASFLAGILTFFSPCVLPLIPVYLTLITGFSLENLMEQKGRDRLSIFKPTLAFVLGFGTVFTLLGITAGVFGVFLLKFQEWLRMIGGVLIIIFGLHIAGAFTILPFYRELRWQKLPNPKGLTGAFLMGIIFAAGWTPCVGPVLASILLLSASQASAAKGTIYLAFYSLGIGVPFLLASLFIGQFQKLLLRIKPHLKIVEICSGSLLIILGILLIINKFGYLAGFLLSR